MDRKSKILNSQPSVLNKSALWLGYVVLVFVTPFLIYNIIIDEWKIAFASFLIVTVSLFNIFSLIAWKKYYPILSLIILSPAMMAYFYFSITNNGVIGVLWVFPAIVAFYFTLPERLAYLVNLFGFILCSSLSFNTFDFSLTSRIIATLSFISLLTAMSVRLINNQQKLLYKMAISDPLTGLYNRTILSNVLSDIINNSHNTIELNHLLTIDIDHFKGINDKFGHDQGDLALIEIAKLIQQIVGEHGVLFRHGGEEFIAVIEQLSWEKTIKIAENIRNEIEYLNLIQDHKITVSIGLSKLKTHMECVDWIKESDNNLFVAKQQGRNQVIAT